MFDDGYDDYDNGFGGFGRGNMNRRGMGMGSGMGMGGGMGMMNDGMSRGGRYGSRGSGGGSSAANLSNYESQTGHSVHMRGLPFVANEQDILDVSMGVIAITLDWILACKHINDISLKFQDLSLKT